MVHEAFTQLLSIDPPSSYAIGEYTITEPLVSIKHLKTHLGLLRAFKDLRTQVETSASLTATSGISDVSERWAWFVNLAVERCEIIRLLSDQ